MPEYLSTDWFDAAVAAVQDDDGLARASTGAHLVIEQTVDDPPPALVWHIRFEDGVVRLVVGAAPDATVTFRCDRDTAVAVHRGTTSAQAAFMAGRLRVGGDVGALLAHQALLSGLEDVLGPLRDQED